MNDVGTVRAHPTPKSVSSYVLISKGNNCTLRTISRNDSSRMGVRESKKRKTAKYAGFLTLYRFHLRS